MSEFMLTPLYYKQILHFNTTEVNRKPLTCKPTDQAGWKSSLHPKGKVCPSPWWRKRRLYSVSFAAAGTWSLTDIVNRKLTMTEWLLFTWSFHGNDIIFVLTTSLEGREIALIFLTEETDVWKTPYLPRLQPVDLQWHKESPNRKFV